MVRDLTQLGTEYAHLRESYVFLYIFLFYLYRLITELVDTLMSVNVN
jgi:hypothetical protein